MGALQRACRSTRTRRCSRCWERRSAATAGSTSPFRTLRGRTPIHVASGHTLGERGGEQSHTLSIAELPEHVHVANATTSQADQSSNGAAPSRLPAQSNFSFLYGPAANLQAMAGNALGNAGGSQPHLNVEPFLVLSFCIALQGIFPSAT